MTKTRLNFFSENFGRATAASQYFLQVSDHLDNDDHVTFITFNYNFNGDHITLPYTYDDNEGAHRDAKRYICAILSNMVCTFLDHARISVNKQ